MQALLLGGTVSSVTRGTTSFEQNLVSAQVYQKTNKRTHSWKTSDACRTLTNDFLDHFQNLPEIDPTTDDITDTGGSGPWSIYVSFLKDHGSHIMITQQLGGAFWEWVSSEEVSSSDASSMQTKACANLRLDSNVSLDACGEYSEEELRQASSITATSYKKALGGTDDARNGVIYHTSSETMDAFFAAANEHPQAYEYGFRPIWEQLAQEYQEQCTVSGSTTSTPCKNLQKAKNLQVAFEGVTAWDCKKTESDGDNLQWLEVQKADAHPVTYQCTAGFTGCANNDACTGSGAHGGGCICRGEGCFVTKEVATNVFTTVVQSGYDPSPRDGGINDSCYCGGVACAFCHCNRDGEWNDRDPNEFPRQRQIWIQTP